MDTAHRSSRKKIMNKWAASNLKAQRGAKKVKVLDFSHIFVERTKSNQGNKNAGRKECWGNGIWLLPPVSFLPSFLREDDEEEKKKRGGGEMRAAGRRRRKRGKV